VLVAFHDECSTNPVATVSEGHLKVVAMRALLGAGASLIEGSGKAAVNKRLCLTDGALRVEEVARRSPEENIARLLAKARPKSDDQPRIRQTSSDLRVCEPCQLVFELQARSIYGSQDTLFWTNLIDDYDRLAKGRADVFVMACDAPIYESLRGNRGDRRGRKAGLPADVAKELLPAAETLEVGAAAQIQDLNSSRFGRLRVMGCRSAPRAAVGRVILATWAVSPSAEPNPELEKVRSILHQHATKKQLTDS
jgi:hypothetical protein